MDVDILARHKGCGRVFTAGLTSNPECPAIVKEPLNNSKFRHCGLEQQSYNPMMRSEFIEGEIPACAGMTHKSKGSLKRFVILDAR